MASNTVVCVCVCARVCVHVCLHVLIVYVHVLRVDACECVCA